MSAICQNFNTINVEVCFTMCGGFTWRLPDCEELVGKIILEMTWVGHSVKKPSKHIQNCPSMTDECQYTFATNYFMYQWAGQCAAPPPSLFMFRQLLHLNQAIRLYSCFIRLRLPHWRNAEKRKNKESAKKYKVSRPAGTHD